jgi:hypothetical protein
MLGGRAGKNKNSCMPSFMDETDTGRVTCVNIFFFTPNDPRGQTFVMAPGRHNQLGLEMCNVHRNFKRITPLSSGNKIIPSARTLLNKTILKKGKSRT